MGWKVQTGGSLDLPLTPCAHTDIYRYRCSLHKGVGAPWSLTWAGHCNTSRLSVPPFPLPSGCCCPHSQRKQQSPRAPQLTSHTHRGVERAALSLPPSLPLSLSALAHPHDLSPSLSPSLCFLSFPGSGSAHPSVLQTPRSHTHTRSLSFSLSCLACVWRVLLRPSSAFPTREQRCRAAGP